MAAKKGEEQWKLRWNEDERDRKNGKGQKPMESSCESLMQV